MSNFLFFGIYSLIFCHLQKILTNKNNFNQQVVNV